jgi:ABC-type thiamin/hydroxymethylpyrimidine transport system permease subunit
MWSRLLAIGGIEMTLIMHTTRTISGWVLTGLLGLLFVGSAAAKVLTAGAASHFRRVGPGRSSLFDCVW